MRLLTFARRLHDDCKHTTTCYCLECLGTKAFINFLSFARRNDLQDTGVTDTCLISGATETEFFAPTDMLDTKGRHACEAWSIFRKKCSAASASHMRLGMKSNVTPRELMAQRGSTTTG